MHVIYMNNYLYVYMYVLIKKINLIPYMIITILQHY